MADEVNVIKADLSKAEAPKPVEPKKEEPKPATKQPEPKKEEKKQEPKKVESNKEDERLKKQEEKRNKLEKEKSELEAKLKALYDKRDKLLEEKVNIMQDGRKEYQKVEELVKQAIISQKQFSDIQKLQSDVTQISAEKEESESDVKKVNDELKSMEKKFYQDTRAVQVLNKFSMSKRGMHILDFAAEFIKSHADINKLDAENIRKTLSEWAKSDSYLKDLSGTIEKEVLKSISAFKKFVISYFAIVKVLGDMIEVINKEEKGAIQMDNKTKEFLSIVLNSSDMPKLPE